MSFPPPLGVDLDEDPSDQGSRGADLAPPSARRPRGTERQRGAASASLRPLVRRPVDPGCTDDQFNFGSAAFSEVYGAPMEEAVGGNDLKRWAKLIGAQGRGRVSTLSGACAPVTGWCTNFGSGGHPMGRSMDTRHRLSAAG